ncbi:hypothetical protein DFH06DRAFT_1420733, partial [Mycena polygramma]
MSLPCRFVATLGQALVRTFRHQRPKALDLPPELWLIVLSFTEKEELWALVQVSQPFRALCLFPLLLRYNIPKSHIYSGSITLSGDACFLVPMIYNIHPILDITINLGNRRFRDFPSILAAVPRIPDVRICGSIDGSKDIQIARLVWTLARNKADPVVIVGLGCITVLYLPYLSIRNFPVITIRELCTVPMVKALLWIPVGRDARQFYRISVAGRSQFTLVTFNNSDRRSRWVMRPLPNLSSEQYTALLSVLHIEDHMTALIVLADCSLDLEALLLFVHRHRLLTNLTLFPGAISSAPLAADVRHPHTGRITSLTAPADYISHLLPTQCCVVDLTVTCSSDGTALARALDTIADLLDSESAMHTLTLKFRTKESHALSASQVLP